MIFLCCSQSTGVGRLRSVHVCLQAYVFKHRSGRNLGWFAPDRMREIGPTEKVGMEQTAFAKLEGLGKIPFSNIRRPRPLMDLEPTQPKEEEVWLLSQTFTTLLYHAICGSKAFSCYFFPLDIAYSHGF